MKIGVIVPAAGASTRYSRGSDVGRSKLDEDLGGKSVLQRTVELFTKHDAVGFIIVAGPNDPAAFAEFKQRHGDKLGFLGASLCVGGKTHRWETVAAALKEVPEDCTHIAVHDAARPCTPVDLIDRVFDAAERNKAVVPGVEVSDTLKLTSETDRPAEEADPLAAILGDMTGGEDEGGSLSSGVWSKKMRVVEKTVDRRGLFAIQTPQVFEAGLLRKAYAEIEKKAGAGSGGSEITDDAALVERLGERVVVVNGDMRNIKITRPGDLPMARMILGVRDQQREAHKRF